VFENGVSVPNENSMTLYEAVRDTFRVNFYKSYIQNLIDASTIDGVNVMGYFAWSLMDNFEWTDGYSVRFGMTYVDYKNNRTRYPKDSLFWYSKFVQTGTNTSVWDVNIPFENPIYEALKAKAEKN